MDVTQAPRYAVTHGRLASVYGNVAVETPGFALLTSPEQVASLGSIPVCVDGGRC